MAATKQNPGYSEDQLQWLRDNVKGTPTEVLRLSFNQQFGQNRTYAAIRKIKHRLHIYNGIDTHYKQGEIHANNTKEYGAERIVEGKKWIKVGKDKWVIKHRYLWEVTHGPIPEGYVVIFADRKPENCDISNLMLVTRQELLIMNEHHLISEDSDYTMSGHLLAKLIYSTKKREKGR